MAFFAQAQRASSATEVDTAISGFRDGPTDRYFITSMSNGQQYMCIHLRET
jgi:hypothetical protein